MTKLTKSKSPPSSPLGRLSFFGSSSTGSLVGPSRPVIQKGPGGRWSIVRVRTPRPDVSTLASCGPNGEWEGDTDAARERREEEGRGYEGMIRPLYLGDATIGDEAHGDTVGAGQGSADAGVQGHEEYGESGPSDAALQAAMLNPTPIPSSLPSHNTYAPCTFSYPPQALRSSTASTVSTIPPVPPIPDAYRALAPRSPTSPTSPGSPRSLSGRTWGSPGKGEGGQYPLSEYADESARDGSEEGCGAMLGRKLEYMPQDPYHGVSAKASAGIATGGEDAGGIKGGLQSAGPVRDPSGHGGSPGDAVETAVVPQPKHHQVIPPGAHAPAPARSPSFLGRGEESPLHHMLPPQDTSQPLSLGSVPPPIQARSFSPADPSAVDLERNPSSSTTGTKSTYNTARASSTDPTTTTDESAALFTPPSVVLLDAHQASGYHWSEEADVGCSTHGHNVEVHTGDDDGTAETVEGMSGEGVTFSDCGMAGVGSYHALPDLAEVALPGPPDVHSRSLSNTPSRSTLTSTSHALTSSDVRRSPTTGKLSRIDWEGDLHHRRSATTINTTTYKNTSTTDHSNNHSKDSSNTNTPTPVPLSLEDGHGERMMRSRAGSTGGQSTALSLYSIGGVLMTEPTKVVKGDNAAQGREKGRRASDASISSAVLLGPPLDQSRVKESGRARTQSMVAPPTHGKIPADYARSLDRVERDGIQVDEQQESRRPRRSSARHSYVLPTRRAPPPPIFYIEQTPPETPSSPARVLDEQQDPVADAVPSTPGRSSLVRRLMSASVLTLPAGNNASLHMTADEPTSASVRNRRRLPSTPKSSTSRGLFSASVVSLPATSGSHRPAQFWHEDEAVPHASPEQVRSPTTPGMLTRVKAMMSASVISLHQQLNPDGRSDDGDRQVGSKAGPVKGLSKRVSMGPEVVHADKRKQEQEQHQTQQKKGGFGEIWRRMSAGRKGRKARASMGAEIPDGAGRVPLNSDCAPTRASIPSQRATSASKGSLPSETAVAHISSSGASTQLKPSLGKRRPVPAYNPANCTDLLPVPANSPAFKSSREKRKSQNIDTSEARRENVSRPPSKILSVPRLSSRPAIRISTAPSPASATLPSLPSPITLANACAIPSSAVTGGKEGGRISPNRHRRRTSSNRHSRPFSMADRQKEEKRRYRRTLIEITDDELFQQVVGDLSRLDVGRPGSLDQAGPGHVRPVPLAGGDGDTKGFSSEIKPAESKPESVDGAIARPGARRTHSSTSVSVSGMASVAYDPWTAPSKTFASPAQPAAAQQLGKATLGEKTVDTTVYGVQAWFVMRELVQGERRHGRLLARGIAVSKQVASHLHTNDVESPPVASSNRNMVRPTSLVEVSSARTGDRLSALRSSTFAVFDRSWSSSAQSSTVNLALDASLVVEEGTLGTAKRCDRQGKSQDGPVDTTMRRSVSFSRITLARTMRSEPEPMLSLTPPRPSSMLVPNSTSVIVRTVREQHRQSFDILLQRLPRLLALSLTLSSRFAHDPSPDQIATAFLSMEDELTAEMAGWAADVGVLIGSGVGKEIDRLRRSGSQSSGGRPTPASPSLRSRSSFPMPSQGGNGNGRSKNTLNMNSASGLADRAALEALADSTAFMPRMGRAHSYATMPSRPPSPGNSPVVVTSHTTVGSSISSFMGLGSSSSTNTNANTGPTTRASQLSNASTVHVRGATSSNTHDDQDRTSFSDVIMAPVQRAARYRLLFGSLAKKMELEHSHSATSRIGLGQSHKPLPRTGTARTAEQRAKLVKDALEASERVLKAVDAAQSYDLGGLRMVEKAKSRSKSRLRRKSQQKGSGLASAPASAPSTSREASAGLEGGSAESVSAEGTAESADFGVAGTNTRQAAMEGVGIDAAYKRHRSRLGASSGDKQAKGKGKGKDKVSAIGEVTAAQVDEAEADESSQVPPSPGAKAQGTPRKEKGGRVKSWGKERRSWRSSVTG